MIYYKLFLILILIQGSVCFEEDYYWREYTGTIPDDAIIGGQDINKENIYIGQAFVSDHGLIVSEIFPGVREVQAPIGGVKSIKSYIKILCGDQQNFYWSPANSTHLHLQMIGKHPVIGGHETGGILYVGRLNYEGNIKIGKIAPFRIQDALLYFNDKGTEKHVGSYEVLLYKNSVIDVRINSQ